MPAPLVESPARLRWQNWGASALLVALAGLVYDLAPWNEQQLSTGYGPPSFAFTGHQFLLAASAGYVVLLAAYFVALDRKPSVSKALRLIGWVARAVRAPSATLRAGLQPEDRLALFSTLLKGFFGPMMTVSLMDFCLGAWRNGNAIIDAGALQQDYLTVFNQFGFWFLLQLILFVDVLVFTIGYLVELPRLGNQIRSVETTLFGWLAALVCYPPFNKGTVAILGSYKSEFPQFDDPTMHLIMNAVGLALMAIYASASVALGLKASNLTHRGIVARGPYALVRHPAYMCKNAAWWIGSVPFSVQAFQLSVFDGLQAIASVVGWTGIYVLRALTEEDHLRRVDGEYEAYAARVRYRFVPGLI